MKTYKTAEVAAIIGIHPNTVRLYEKLKLIPKPERIYRISYKAMQIDTSCISGRGFAERVKEENRTDDYGIGNRRF